jgi:hypothetical protein
MMRGTRGWHLKPPWNRWLLATKHELNSKRIGEEMSDIQVPNITKQEAEFLFEGGELVGEWEYVVQQEGDSHRWHTGWTLVLRHIPTGELWGLEYETGLTENQENSYPWDDGRNSAYLPMKLKRLHPHTKVITAYERFPATPPTS